MLNNGISTQVVGSGPDLVLLHGWGVHSIVWKFVAQQLAKDFKITLVDLPGFGLSKMAKANYHPDEIASLILSVVPENATWIGWSLGGLLATHCALQYPARVKKLVTVASTPRFIRDVNWPGMDLKILRQFSDQLQSNYEATVMRFLLLQFHGSVGYKEKLYWLEKNLFMYGKPKTEVLLGGLHLLESLDLREKLTSLQCETLCIFGRLDALIPSDVSLAIKECNPNIHCELLPKASHALFLSHEVEFLNLLRKFLHE